MVVTIVATDPTEVAGRRTGASSTIEAPAERLVPWASEIVPSLRKFNRSKPPATKLFPAIRPRPDSPPSEPPAAVTLAIGA